MLALADAGWCLRSLEFQLEARGALQRAWLWQLWRPADPADRADRRRACNKCWLVPTTASLAKNYKCTNNKIVSQNMVSNKEIFRGAQ